MIIDDRSGAVLLGTYEHAAADDITPDGPANHHGPPAIQGASE